MPTLQDEINHRTTFPTLFTCILVTIGFVMPIGYNFTNFYNSMIYILFWFHEVLAIRYNWYPTFPELSIIWLIVKKIIIVGGVIGIPITIILNKKFGRKGALLTSAILQICAGLLFIFSRLANSLLMLCIGRTLIGISTSIIFITQPMYFFEIVPIQWRGCAGSLTWIGVTFGSCLGQVLTLTQLLGTKTNWNLTSGIFVVFVLIGLLFIYWMPESPNWIAQKFGDQAIALNTIEIHAETYADNLLSFYDVITNSEFIFPLLVVGANSFCQQFCSVYVVFYYFTIAFERGGLARDTEMLLNLGAGILNFVGAIISASILLKVKLRKMMQISTMGCAITLIAMAFTLFSMMKFQDEVLKPISASLIFVYIIFYNLGLGPIPFFTAAEIFDSRSRAVAMNIGNFFFWTGQLLAFIVFHFLKESSFCFIPSAIVCFCCFSLTFHYDE